MPSTPRAFCVVITLDVKNAFNSANWERIYLAIRDKVPEDLLPIVSNYLSSRKLVYETDEGTKEIELTAGVPQGSVLAPFLWNAHYDDLLRLEMPNGLRLIGYADDIAVIGVAENTAILEWACNEALHRVSTWLMVNNLKLSLNKCEALLVTKRRKFAPPVFEIDGQAIPIRENLKYLGVWLDKNWNFGPHCREAAAKANRVGTALSHLMPNIGGPKIEQRKLYCSVVHSTLLYGAPVWGLYASRTDVELHLGKVQRKAVLRVISGYRTISGVAAGVLACVPPIRLLIREAADIWHTQERARLTTGTINHADRAKIREEARTALMLEWQNEWESNAKGRWTHRLIPNIRVWMNRPHGDLDYHLTQVFSGHGSFGHYLHKRKRRADSRCQLCGDADDDTFHAIFACRVFETERQSLMARLNTTLPLRPESLTHEMLKDNQKWTDIANFLRGVMLEREKKEREERR